MSGNFLKIGFFTIFLLYWSLIVKVCVAIIAADGCDCWAGVLISIDWSVSIALILEYNFIDFLSSNTLTKYDSPSVKPLKDCEESDDV